MLEVHPPVPNNAEFNVGAHWRAPNGYTLLFTNEGNLELRSPAGSKLWESRTAGRGAGKLAMQADGNLVIYDRTLKTPIWSTNTNGHRGAFLALQEDGNVVIYTPDRRPVWATATAGKR
jgi:hypothetical protein